MENSSLNHTENHKTEEKETKRTPIKQRKKENEVLRFIREHIRYFAAGALVVVLILVLAMCAKPKGSDSDVVVNANADGEHAGRRKKPIRWMPMRISTH